MAAPKRAVCSDAHAARKCVAICEPCYEMQMAAARLSGLLRYLDATGDNVFTVTSEQRAVVVAAQKAVDDGGQ